MSAKPRIALAFGVNPDALAANLGTPPVVAAGEDPGTLPGAWHAVLVVEGMRTTDHRSIAPGALIWRELPIPIMWQVNSTWGHDGAVLVGRIDTIERDEASGKINATGTWDLAESGTGVPAYGREAARLARDGFLRWVSVDLEVMASELVEIGTPPMMDLDWLFWSTEGSGLTAAATELEYDWYEEYTDARIMGATMLPFPAFPQAVIAPSDQALPDVPPMREAPQVDRSGLIACSLPDAPPAAWFEDPALTGPTPLTVGDDGRVFGHIATWGSCHTGFADTCVCPPRSERAYAYAMTGRVRTAEGDDVPVGHLTVATGHAGLSLDHRAAAAHYDDTGAAVVDWAYGEDAYGIWGAGAIRPGTTDEQIRVVRASAPSGDWREIGGSLELVACLAVNVPGFPVLTAAGRPAQRRTVGLGPDGERVALVAAGRLERDPLRPLRDAVVALAGRIRNLEGLTAPLTGLAVERTRDRIGV